MAIGRCFCNDLRYAAEELGTPIANITVRVAIELEGSPLLAKSATLAVTCTMSDGTLPDAVVERAKEVTMVSNSIRRGFPVEITSVGK